MGIDEVGRGSLAGPITVTAVAIPHRLRFKEKVRDSKGLTSAGREAWFSAIYAHPAIFHATAFVYPKTIDRVNIAEAANLAATRALACLLAASDLGFATKVEILLDGGLFINAKIFAARSYALNPRTIVRGDQKYTCIKLASIVAKVKRDHTMRRWHRIYPAYGFAVHKGYGTKAHIAALKRHGGSPIHRLTFIKNFVKK